MSNPLYDRSFTENRHTVSTTNAPLHCRSPRTRSRSGRNASDHAGRWEFASPTTKASLFSVSSFTACEMVAILVVSAAAPRFR